VWAGLRCAIGYVRMDRIPSRSEGRLWGGDRIPSRSEGRLWGGGAGLRRAIAYVEMNGTHFRGAKGDNRVETESLRGAKGDYGWTLTPGDCQVRLCGRAGKEFFESGRIAAKEIGLV
jgi:hypothetical protein